MVPVGVVWDYRWVNFVDKHRVIALYLWWKLVSVLHLEQHSINFLCMRVDIRKECYGIANRCILSKNYRVMALDFKIWNFVYKILIETTAFHFHKYGPWFMDCLPNKNSSWRGMMHACSAFIKCAVYTMHQLKWLKSKMKVIVEPFWLRFWSF